MKFYTENAAATLRALATCLRRDPASLGGWSCLHLPAILKGSPASLARVVSETASLEGTGVALSSGDLLLVFRAVEGAGAARLATLIASGLGCQTPETAHTYDLFRDHALLSGLFEKLASAEPQNPALVSLNSPEELAGVRYMAEVFKDSKWTRTYRSPMRVLLVEDDPVTRQLAGRFLGREHVLITAADAYEAVVNYLLYAPEVVFLDINLPDQSGFRVLEQLTACDPEAYIIMFSGQDSFDNIIAAFQHGAQGFIAKPFKQDQLKYYLNERGAGRSG